MKITGGPMRYVYIVTDRSGDVLAVYSSAADALLHVVEADKLGKDLFSRRYELRSSYPARP